MPGFLQTMLAYADEHISVVGALSIYEDISSGKVNSVFQLSKPQKWESNDYMKRLMVVGNELGQPSCTLFRRDAIDIISEAWENTLSCDFVCNVIAASRGCVVLLPPGGIIIGNHENRDSRTQSMDLFMKPLINTVTYLQQYPDYRVARVGRVHGCVEFLGLFRTIFGAIRRGDVRVSQFLGTAVLSASHEVRLSSVHVESIACAT